LKYIDEYRNKNLAKIILKQIDGLSHQPINLMEVCGTHTVAIFRHGLRKVLPPHIQLISGPGCPVCVTPIRYIDEIIAFAREKEFIITTFGDMMRVPGSTSSLEKEKAKGADIRMVYSTLDALQVAEDNPFKKIIFVGIGFETTAPTIASAILKAEKEKIKNFFVLSMAKLIPPVLKGLLESKEININGFLYPGHVSTIIGSQPYSFIASQYHIPGVIAGFEPLDILQSIYMLVKQIENNQAEIAIQYERAVKPEGNEIALARMKKVFNQVDSDWRGIGRISRSGLEIKEDYHPFNARKFAVEIEETREFEGCRCGEVLRGIINPPQCSLFTKICTPENPRGACMVSSEGTCAAYYKYGNNI